MEVTLKFDMAGEDDDSLELEYALNGWKMSIILWDLDQYLRGKSKYGTAEDQKIDVDKMRDKLREIMEEYGLTFSHKMFN